jgi:hypothetical protein
MKRIFQAICLFICLFILAACGGGEALDGNENLVLNGSLVEDIPMYNCEFEPPPLVGFTDGVNTVFLDPADLSGRVDLQDLLNPGREIKIFRANGEIESSFDFLGAYLEGRDGRIDFVFSDGRIIVNIAGIIADPPPRYITQVYDEALNFLQEGHSVAVIVLDAWGWEKYHYFADLQPFLHGLHSQSAEIAHTVFPPFTPVAMSSIFTGQTPNIHGVHDRATRMMAAPDIFYAATNLGFSVTQVQGAVNVVQTSANVVLMPDLNNAYGTDDEVFSASMARINDSDLLFVHFKGIDEQGHTYGPYTPEVAARIALIDGFVQEMYEARGGIFILVGDHGMSCSADLNNPRRLGDHRFVSHEDFFVPYLIIGGVQ